MTIAAIEASRVTLRFGDHVAIEDITFVLPQGEFLAVVGPNGAGKSTLLKILLGILEPTEGEVLVFGERPSDIPPDRIGYVPQIKTLDRSFPAVAVELVLTGLLGRWPGRSRADRIKQAQEAMERTGTAHLANRPIGHLSGGELQRVYLARSLVRRPDLIVLDEPATGMDLAGELGMYDSLESYQNETGATVFMITHDWQVARHHADLVLVMDRRVVSFGSAKEALAEEPMRRAFGHIGHTHHLRTAGGEFPYG